MQFLLKSCSWCKNLSEPPALCFDKQHAQSSYGDFFSAFFFFCSPKIKNKTKQNKQVLQ